MVGRKTGGRKPGSLNKSTIALRRASVLKIAARQLDTGEMVPGFDGDAHLLLVSIYRNPQIPLDIRLEAAKAAIRYERAPIAPVAAPEAPELIEDKARRLHLLIAEMKSTIGGDSSNGHAAVPDLN